MQASFLWSVNLGLCLDSFYHFLGLANLISDSIIRNTNSKGPKYRIPDRIDLKTCREEIVCSLS